MSRWMKAKMMAAKKTRTLTKIMKRDFDNSCIFKNFFMKSNYKHYSVVKYPEDKIIIFYAR